MENTDVPGNNDQTPACDAYPFSVAVSGISFSGGCRLCGSPSVRSQYFSKGNVVLFVCSDCAYVWSVKYDKPPQTPKLESEFKAGEIRAWRCWQIYADGSYGSTAVEDITWTFDNVIEGDPANLAEGIHAWKTREQALSYGTDWFAGKTFAIGEVDLWGEVIEHEQGYRAQYAQMVSCEHMKASPSIRAGAITWIDDVVPHWSVPLKAMIAGCAFGAIVYGGIGYVIWRALQ